MHDTSATTEMGQPASGSESAEAIEAHRRAAEGSPLPIALTEGDEHRVSYANAAFYQLFSTPQRSRPQLSRPQLSGPQLSGPGAEEPSLRLSALVRDPAALDAALDSAARSGVAQVTHDVVYVRTGGAPLQATTIATPIDRAAATLLVQIVEAEPDRVRDLEEANEKLLLAGLREQELADRANQTLEEMKALLANTSEGVTVFDAAGAIVMINASGRTMLELPDDATTEDYARICLRWPDGVRVDFRGEVLNRLLHAKSIVDEEVLLCRADGSTRYMLFSGSAVRDREDRVALAINVFRDVTHLRELERVRERYLSLVSHDLRNPLAGASAAAQLLIEQSTNELDRQLARRIEKSLDRMDAMLRDLLDVQRVRTGRELPLTLSETDLALIARDVVEDMTNLYGKRFELRGDESVPGIWSASELERAIRNLVNNAVKYGAPNRPITITTKRRTDGAMITVHNEGEPISAADQSRLFAPFARAAKAGVEGVHGWGLGLALVRACAQAHGGEVRVHSDSQSGTRFTMTLPLDSRPHQR